jgi:hypothetical protein
MTTLRKPVHRVAPQPLSAFYGPDSGKRIVVSLTPGNGGDVADLITLRPERTRRAEVIAVVDVYRYAMACRLNRGNLEKARAKKAAKIESWRRAKLARDIRKVNA